MSMSVWQIHTTAVLMHFVITPTDPSIAYVNLDLQEMEKTAQVVFTVLCLFSYGSRNFITTLLFTPPDTTCFLQQCSDRGGSRGGGLGGSLSPIFS